MFLKEDDHRVFNVDLISYSNPGGAIDIPSFDAETRDFTINTLTYNIETGQVEDLLNGRALDDIAKRRLCKVKESSLTDDTVRILRLLRFAIKYELQIGVDEMCLLEQGGVLDSGLRDAVKKNPQRFSAELDKILKLEPSQTQKVLRFMDRFHVWQEIMFDQRPEDCKTGI